MKHKKIRRELDETAMRLIANLRNPELPEKERRRTIKTIRDFNSPARAVFFTLERIPSETRENSRGASFICAREREEINKALEEFYFKPLSESARPGATRRLKPA